MVATTQATKQPREGEKIAYRVSSVSTKYKISAKVVVIFKHCLTVVHHS